MQELPHGFGVARLMNMDVPEVEVVDGRQHGQWPQNTCQQPTLLQLELALDETSITLVRLSDEVAKLWRGIDEHLVNLSQDRVIFIRQQQELSRVSFWADAMQKHAVGSSPCTAGSRL